MHPCVIEAVDAALAFAMNPDDVTWNLGDTLHNWQAETLRRAVLYCPN